MTPPTGTALLILAVFVLPGFVTLLLRERLFVVRGEDTPFERLLNALYYSAVSYAVVFAAAAALGLNKGDLADFYKGKKSLVEDLGAAALVAIVVPMIVALLGMYWRRSATVRPWILSRFRISAAHGGASSAWNHAFNRETAMMLRVTLKDGRVVGGFFGRRSLAGYSEHAQDLFVENRWSLDDDNWFLERASGTEGVWMSRDEIVSIEFYNPFGA